MLAWPPLNVAGKKEKTEGPAQKLTGGLVKQANLSGRDFGRRYRFPAGSIA